jgi:BarA-like signal transduction histidine kinase
MTTKVISTVKKYYNQLLIQIHPDFFHSEPIKKEWNQRTTSVLNSLLEQLPNDPQTDAIHLKFYTKQGDKIEHVLDPFQGKTQLQLRNVDKTSPWCISLLQLFKTCGIEVDLQDLEYSRPLKQKSQDKVRFGTLFKESTHSPYWKDSKSY